MSKQFQRSSALTQDDTEPPKNMPFILLTIQMRCFFCCPLYLMFLICLSYVAVSAPCSLVITCGNSLTSWLSCVLCFLVVLSRFHCGVLVQVWCLGVSIPDLWLPIYYENDIYF